MTYKLFIFNDYESYCDESGRCVALTFYSYEKLEEVLRICVEQGKVVTVLTEAE